MNPSKGALLTQTLKDHPQLLQCPKCHETLGMEGFGLVCNNSHRFDLSKKGYVHLLMKQVPASYPKELFEARHRCAQRGVFHPLTEKIGGLMASSFPVSTASANRIVLDAGCGEGSLTRQLAARQSLQTHFFCGIDLSKDGILQAAREPSTILWTVGDLARLPFQKETFHWVLNILSPANYKEFARVLKPDGILLKVVPGALYLKSIRDVMYQGTKGQSYDNARIKEHFEKHMHWMEVHSLTYTLTPDEETLKDLLDMTPLLMDRTPDQNQWAELKKIQTWCLDYEIILGKMK